MQACSGTCGCGRVCGPDFFFWIFILFRKRVCCLCTRVQVSTEASRGGQISWIWNCKANSGPLQEQYALLTRDPSLQPNKMHLDHPHPSFPSQLPSDNPNTFAPTFVSSLDLFLFLTLCVLTCIYMHHVHAVLILDGRGRWISGHWSQHENSETESRSSTRAATALTT